MYDLTPANFPLRFGHNGHLGANGGIYFVGEWRAGEACQKSRRDVFGSLPGLEPPANIPFTSRPPDHRPKNKTHKTH